MVAMFIYLLLYQVQPEPQLMKRLFTQPAITILFVGCFCVLLGSSGLQAQNVNVNPGAGTYPTLADAFTAINNGTHTGAVTVDIAGNTTEAVSAVLNASGTGAASYTSVTISPSGGARTVTGAITGHLIDLNGADNVTISGGNNLTIANTALGASSTIRFFNDASNNTITQTSLQGSGTASFGVVTFSTGTTTGNDGNNINNCSIGPAGSNQPLNGIFSLGTSAAIDNSGNTINANNIFDYFNAGSASNGLNVNTGNSTWTITNNRFFQTGTRTYTTGSTHNGIVITSGVGYTITGNLVGAATSTGTGFYTMTGTVATRFVGINLGLTAGAPASSIQGNSVYSVTLTTSSGASTTNGVLCGINLTSGDANIGTVTGNILGATSGTGSLATTPSTTQGAVVGIHCSTTGAINISGNTIGALSSTGTTAAIAGAVTGINISGIPSALSITNNTIGNSTANNMLAGVNPTTTGSSIVSGINLSGAIAVSSTITGNTVQNLTSFGTGTAGFVRGIWTGISGASAFNISNNIVNNLTTNSASTAVGNGQLGAMGIYVGTGTTPVISGNTVSNISNINAGAVSTNVAGISHTNGSNTLINGNRVFGITNASTATSTTLPGLACGVFIRGGASNLSIVNNMISLGTAQTTNTAFVGIVVYSGGGTPTVTQVFHNSIVISGTVAAGAQPSMCFYRGNFSTAAIAFPVDVRNNIFINERTGGTGPHLAIANNYGATTVSATGWGANASNFNVLNSASASTIGWWTSAQTFAGWQAASAGDGNSLTGASISFVNTATADLHIATPTSPIESVGTPIASVTVDFDNQIRANFSPVDIGADAGNFTNAPIIAITPVTNQCFGAPAIVLSATITDVDGVPTTGAGLPVLYWRINAGAYTPVTAVHGGGSTYSFTFGAGVPNFSTISYYIVAQDNIGNVGSFPSPGAGGFTANPPAAATPPTSPNSYFVGSLNGTYTVGSGGAFPTLTAAATAYGNSCLAGPVVFSLTDATYSASETFPIVFGSNPDASATNTLTIKPTGTTTISGTSATSIIVLNGADFVTIDGSNGSTVNTVCPPVAATRNLTITNTSTSATSTAVVSLQTTTGGNAATNNKVINCNIIGGSNTGTSVGINISGTAIGSGAGANGNNNNQIINNAVSKVAFGIFSAGSGAATRNTGNVFNQNVMTETVASTNAIGRVGIMVLFEDGTSIQRNQVANIVGGSATSFDVMGIVVGTNNFANTTAIGAETINATVAYNSVDNILANNTFSGGGIVLGVANSGTTNVTNNMVSNIYANGTSPDIGAGIYAGGGTGITNIYHNSVTMSTVTALTGGALPNAALAVNNVPANPIVNVKNNILVANGPGNGATIGNVAIGLNYAAPFTNLASNNNVLFVSGTGSHIGLTTSISNTGVTATTLANWQAVSGGDVMSTSNAPVFTSTTDLHLVAADPANASLICGGMAVASVTNDIDCQNRKVTPTIGADELPASFTPSIAVAETSGTPNDGAICVGSSATLTASATGSAAPTYAWSTGATTAAITVNTAGTYTVSVTDGSCVATATSVISTNALPTPGIAVTDNSGTTPNDGIICAGAAAQLTASGGGTYLWSVGGFTTSSIAVVPPVTTTFTVTVTNANGCSASTSTVLTVNALPIPNVTIVENSGLNPNDGIICAGASALIMAQNGTSYLWSTSETTSSISVSTSGTFTVQVIDANGCSASSAASITVNPLPAPSITPTNVGICPGSSTTLTALGGSTYAWSTLATTAAITVNTVGTYTVTATNSNGCASATSSNVTSLPVPIITSVPDSIIQPTTCVATNGFIGGLFISNASSPVSFLWSNGSTAPRLTSLGVGVYTVTVTSGNGCTTSTTITLAGPGGCSICPTIASVMTSTPVCTNTTTTLTASGLASMGVTFGIQFVSFPSATANPYAGGTVVGGVANGDLSSGGTEASDTTTLTPGTQVIYAILSPTPTDPSCRPSANVAVTVNTPPTTSILVTDNSGTAINDGIICQGASATLTASGGGTYAWSTLATTAGIITDIVGTYTVTVTNTAGCSVTATRTITVNALPTVTITASDNSGTFLDDGIVCAGASATLTASGGTSYAWSTLATTAGIIVTNAGTYTVTATNANGCSTSTSIVFVSNPLPTAAIAVTETSGIAINDGIICQGASAILTASGGTSYTWSTLATTAGIIVTDAGSYTVTVTNANGCSSVTSTAITVNPLPTASIAVAETSGTAPNDGILCQGASATLTASGGTSYAWSTLATTAAVTVNTSGTYTVTVTNANGCSSTTSTVITVNPLPTAFAVTGGGSRCATDGGLAVSLTGTGQAGVRYRLFLNSLPVDSITLSAPGPVNFAVQSAAGTYTANATTLSTGCSVPMTGNVTISVVNCTVSITDPCVCLNNATSLTNGQFGEVITVNAPAGQVWTVTAINGLFSASSPNPPAAPIALAVGTVLSGTGTSYTLNGRHIDALGYTVSVSNGRGTTLSIGNSCAYPNPSFVTNLAGPFCLFTPTITLAGNPGDANIASQGFTVNGISTSTFNASALGVGTHTVVYTVNGGLPKANGPNDPGCIQSISQTVSIVATPAQVACNDVVNLSLDNDCSVEILPDMVLEGTYLCFDDYRVEIDRTLPLGNGPWTSPAVVTATDLAGGRVGYRVTHLVSGNTCWGEIKLEDKLAPTIECEDIFVPCTALSLDPNYLSRAVSVGGLGIAEAIPTATDNCGGVNRIFTDVYTDLTCEDEFSAVVNRLWTVSDAFGNSNACTQLIYLERPTIADVSFPGEVTVSCNNGNTSPSTTGYPSVTWENESGADIEFPLIPGVGACEIQALYEDDIIPVCDGTYKILRTWTVVSWCDPITPFPPSTNPQYYVQLIKVVDEVDPVIANCPSDLTIGTNTTNCCANFNLPDVIVEDACSRMKTAVAKIFGFDTDGNAIGVFTVNGTFTSFPANNLWDNDTLAAFGNTPCLPLGNHVVEYTLTDDCGNAAVCTFNLTVEDQTPPYPIAHEWTQVAIGADGQITVSAASFDNGSYDDCGDVDFRVRRMDANPCQDNSVFRPSVKFCCSDVGDTIMVIFRVYDLPVESEVGLEAYEGHYSDVMIQVLVEDKLRPICQAPAPVTVNCETFDATLWSYGTATFTDNCCLGPEIAPTADYSRFDTVCNRGTITRTFRRSDCHGNGPAVCTQRIIVNYVQDYFVRFPNDVIVTTCNAAGNYGQPTFFGEDCELLGVSYTDDIFTVVPDACFKIERTWNVLNWCTYNPNAGLIPVPNPNPNATTNSTQNLPGPIVSEPGTLAPWAPSSIALTPGAPAFNFGTLWNANANGYTYKQIIKVIDTQAPTVNCPTSPVEFCDVTDNNDQLWNASFWWDALIGSHDLCEGDVDLTINTTDACSGANVSVRFLLFLDLDGDGTQESVVNSTTLGIAGLGWNAVPYNNVSGAGVIRQFDGRPVPANQKYGFALQQTVSGTTRTASVRWNTQQNMNSYVVPQLPYGKHKIKWFINDGCGNEKECVYEFIVKDCKAPIVVCINGLSSNIGPTGVCPTLWVTDFLLYAYDNCTPEPLLKYGIRKSGTGTGFPYAAGSTTEGNQEVSYGCQDLPAGATSDLEFVEVWAIDRAGNASFCETFVKIQDNSNVCGNGTNASVAGVLKTEEVEGVEASTVSLQGAVGLGTVTSDVQGAYMFSNALPIGSNSTVTALNNQDPKNGVTTFDLLLISRHILGLEPLNTPYKMIAADANKSNTITSFDIVELRKLVLGVYSELPNNTSWRFVDKSQQFLNPQNPFAETIREDITIAQIQANQFAQDFVGVKVGDVNGSAQANGLMAADDRSAGTLMFDVNDQTVVAGQEVVVNFKAADKQLGYQFTMNLNGLEVEEIIPGANLTEENFAVFADALTTSAYGASEFSVKFRATKGGKLSEMIGASSRITRAVANNEAGENLEIAFRFNNGGVSTVTGVGFELYQNSPNPFVSKTFIGFHLPESASAVLTVMDETGRVVYTQEGDFAKGYNAIALDRSQVGVSGMLYYKLETATHTATRKMIQTK
jgi:trimeric autotransporter adhesin